MNQEHIDVDEYDKSILNKYIEFTAELARTPDDDPTLEVAIIFNNVTLDNFTKKLFDTFEEIKESGSIDKHIDQQGNFVVSTKVYQHRHIE